MKKSLIHIISFIFALAAILSCIPAAYAIETSAQSAILIEADSGNVIYEKNAHTRLPMASTTKIMTALTAVENSSLTDEVTVSAAACGVEGSSIYLVPGEKLTMEELLYAMLLESANDAAAAIAIHVAGSIDGFAELMNAKAAELSLSDTHFSNPHGLYAEDHYTTAEDLAKIAACALRNDDIRKIVSTYKHTIPLRGDEGVRVLINHNRLLKMSNDVIGVKTGFTKKSGRCLVSAAERDGVRVIAVTLNAPDDWNDHLAMHTLGFDEYQSYPLAAEGEFSIDIPAVGSDDGTVTVSNRDALTLTLPRGEEIECVTEAPHLLLTQVFEGDTVGRVVFYSRGNEIGSVPLYADETTHEIKKDGFIEKIKEMFR